MEPKNNQMVIFLPSQCKAAEPGDLFPGLQNQLIVWRSISWVDLVLTIPNYNQWFLGGG
jgi:hypothetical protein